ncbi:uncharacterized protein LAESUDRAFT_808686 [Laetiporus sulphureus 93-53]|uniref:Uncharacterized protein n=1 Tax=Laetiporus sulphureus 93-53 TaxID=1314785 RepID=A0A165ILN7_9APHY|nr:uncharacterized protein LAESUDRAFT_808686 [Laetiporus sulphureus 93-53]KZT13251.1 hypothetical protein LAESUDRAFT_808686 [Laetiporus sulphureus 93-53]
MNSSPLCAEPSVAAAALVACDDMSSFFAACDEFYPTFLDSWIPNDGLADCFPLAEGSPTQESGTYAQATYMQATSSSDHFNPPSSIDSDFNWDLLWQPCPSAPSPFDMLYAPSPLVTDSPLSLASPMSMSFPAQGTPTISPAALSLSPVVPYNPSWQAPTPAASPVASSPGGSEGPADTVEELSSTLIQIKLAGSPVTDHNIASHFHGDQNDSSRGDNEDIPTSSRSKNRRYSPYSRPRRSKSPKGHLGSAGPSLAPAAHTRPAIPESNPRNSQVDIPEEAFYFALRKPSRGCPAHGCGYVPASGRAPDLKRHMQTHDARWGKKTWVCCGLPIAVARDRHGWKEGGLKAYEYRGREMVGGCMRTFSRRDALVRHLNNHECWGDVELTKMLSRWQGYLL